MSAAAASDRATALLAEAMHTEFRKVPPLSCDPLYEDERMSLSREEFVFRTRRGVAFYYRVGERLIAELPRDGLLEDFELFLRGTVFGAIASLNGMFVLHASAVVIGGQAVLFTGNSGAGKSTLAAALSKRGYPVLCDDTLVTILTKDGPVALPDCKPAKLWSEGLALAGVEAEDEIESLPGKFFAELDNRAQRWAPLKYGAILHPGETFRLAPITGARKLPLFCDAIYRPDIHIALSSDGEHAESLLTLSREVKVWEIFRPFDPPQFAHGVDQIARFFSRECGVGD